jgi:AcrR family transcriptional regulator
MSTKNEDRRVRRTKKLLLQGLTQLMEQKPIKDITVRELTDLVDLNRGTFYIHYRDVFDMLEQVEKELFEQFDRLLVSHEQDLAAENAFPLLSDLFRFIADNADVCRALIGQNGDMAFMNRLNGVVRDKCLSSWKTLSLSADRRDFEYYYSFVVSGCIGLIRSWLDAGAKETPDCLAKITERIITRGIPAKA